MSKEVKLIADSIVYAVQNERQKVTTILLKNGVVVPSGTSDAKLIVLVSDVFKKSKPFRKDFLELISKSQYISSNFGGYSNVNGFSSENYTLEPVSPFKLKTPTSLTSNSVLTSDSVLNSVPTVASSNNGSSSGSSFWSTSNIMGLLNKASDTYTSVSADKANIALAEAAKARAEAGLVDETAGGSTAPDSGSNTLLYVVLAIVSIGAIGGLVWYVSKSKK